MAKRVRISDDVGATWHTLPGASGELRTELTSFTDTIFGQNFESGDVSIGMWNISANGYFKGLAGYTATLRRGGTPTSMVAEPMSLVSGKTYQVTQALRRMLSLNHAVVVLVNAVDQTANVISIDYLDGTITFNTAFTVTGPVTITASFLPMVVLAKARTFSLTQTAAEIETTDYETAQANGAWKTFTQGLKTVGLELGGIFAQSEALIAALQSRAVLYVEVSPDAGQTTFKGFFKRANVGQSGEVGALEESTQQLTLHVPDGNLIARPFGWYYGPTSTLNQAIRRTLNAWDASTPIEVQYLHDGVVGNRGTTIVTECSLTNNLDGINEFQFNYRGSGTLSTVP